MTEPGVKRKRPPTFEHYPINRAKKLKKAWVETAKIKSKWKAEKRKEGLASVSKLNVSLENGDEKEDSDEEEKDATERDARSEASDAEEVMKEAPPAPKIPSKAHQVHPSRSHIHPDLAPPPKKKLTKAQKAEEVEEAKPPPSVRELTREAYSRETLHTFKADPLHRRRGQPARGRGGSSRGGTGRGGGQPNMKLRMNAMLAKIKQDFA